MRCGWEEFKRQERAGGGDVSSICIRREELSDLSLFIGAKPDSLLLQTASPKLPRNLSLTQEGDWLSGELVF